MAEPVRPQRVHIPEASDKDHSVSVVAYPPRRRDFLKVLFGRWTPIIRRESAMTAAGLSKILKETWTSAKLEEMWASPSPLMDLPEEGDDG